jgi:hypothetical protein
LLKLLKDSCFGSTHFSLAKLCPKNRGPDNAIHPLFFRQAASRKTINIGSKAKGGVILTTQMGVENS